MEEKILNEIYLMKKEVKEEFGKVNQKIDGLENKVDKLVESNRELKINQIAMIKLQTHMLKEQRKFEKETQERFLFDEELIKKQGDNQKILQKEIDYLNKKIDGGLAPVC